MVEISKKNYFRDYKEQEMAKIRLKWKEYTDSLKENGGQDFEDKYGSEAVEVLTESYRRLNQQTGHLQTNAEMEAARMYEEAMEEQAYNGAQANDEPYKERNVVQQIRKGGIRGTALLWNGIVDIGRGAIDPENWAYWGDLMTSVNDGLKLGGRDRSWANYWKEVKEEGVRGNKGFKNSWMRAVMEKDELAQYRQRLGLGEDIFSQQQEGGASIKFDKIPFLNEDLGLVGNATEIAVQEILTMGPLALGKLYRANKVAKYFASKAGGPIKPGRMTKDGYRSSKIETELGDRERIMKAVDEHDVNYKEYMEELKSYPAKEKRKKLELLKVNQTKGRFLKFGGGAYSEAEILTSGAVVAGGLWFQSMFGHEASVIGEVGGGIAGARIAAPILRNATDWLTFLRYKLPGNRDTKMMRAFKTLGYTDDEILNMSSTKKAKLFNAVTATPIPRWMGFTSRERKRLNHMRHWDGEFQSLPDSIRDPLMERMDEVKRLVDRFDKKAGGTGKLFTTIDRAFDMAWLASLRSLVRNKKRIGHGVKVKFDIDEMELVQREVAVARELNTLMSDLSKKSYGDADFGALLASIDAQLLKSTQRLKGEKTIISNQAREIEKAIKRRLPTDKVQMMSYSDPGGFRNDWDSGVRLVRTSEIGTRPLQDFDETSANKFSAIFSMDNAEDIQNALEKNNLRMIRVNKKDGSFSHNVLMPITRGTRSTDINTANESERIFNAMENADKKFGSAQYNGIEGFGVSPANATDKKVSALGSRQVNEMTQRIGDTLASFMENNPGVGTRRITTIKGKDVDLYDWLRGERLRGLEALERKIGSRQYYDTLDELNKNLDAPYDIALTKADANGMLVPDVDNIDNLEFLLAGTVELQLPDAVKLNISLEDLHAMRSGLMRNAMTQMKNNSQRVSGGLNLQVADILTTELDKFDNIKEANQIWRTQVGDKWRRGIGRRISTGMVEPEQFFQQFINSSTPVSARLDFDRMFLKGDGITYDEDAVNLLRSTVEKMLDNNRGIPDTFWRHFGEDVLDVKLLPEEDIVTKSKSIYRTTEKQMSDFGTEMEGVQGEIASKIDETTKAIQAQAELRPEFLFEGLTLEKIEGLFGKDITDMGALRKAILSESYEGGDSRKLLALTKILKGDAKNFAKNKKTLQKILYDGAMEETYSIRSTKGIGFEEAAIDILPDGSKQLKPGRLHEQLEVDSSALQLYVTRNQKILEQVMEPEQLEDLKALSSLVTLVTGQLTQQAVENFPRSLKLNALLSRAYGVVRGVVSPRWVLTELLIQQVRFGRGRMITDMATDPDAFELLSDVILRDGLTKPRIRGEFVEYFYGTLLRISRDIFEAEGEGDLQTMSENVWNQAGGGNR